MGACFGRNSQDREDVYRHVRIDFGQPRTARTEVDSGIVQSIPEYNINNKSNMVIPSETDALPIPERINVNESRGSGVKVQRMSQREDDDVYPMNNYPHGICIIIANEHFNAVGLGQRRGNEYDVNRLETLFQKLRFIVEVKRDCTALEIKNHLNDVKNRITSNMDCFICVICSHGREDGVCGTDNKTVTREKIKEMFDGSNCTLLRGKPKLFFFQACAGAKRDVPVGKTVIDGSALGTSLPPTKADMYSVCASYPGYVSIREEQKGSWFIQTLVDVVEISSRHQDINSIITKVNRIVCRKQADLGDGYSSMQCVQSRSTLRRQFYLK